MRFVGNELIRDIQVVMSSDQHLPVAGGLLDQSAWWFALREAMRHEEHRIDEEQAKRKVK